MQVIKYLPYTTEHKLKHVHIIPSIWDMYAMLPGCENNHVMISTERVYCTWVYVSGEEERELIFDGQVGSHNIAFMYILEHFVLTIKYFYCFVGHRNSEKVKLYQHGQRERCKFKLSLVQPNECRNFIYQQSPYTCNNQG